MKQKQATSIRLSEATKKQIAWLIEQGHGNQTEVIALAIYSMYLREQEKE